MNKKGFTLIELMSVIVIIALISGIATISYTSFINQSRERTFESYMDTLHAEVSTYLMKNTNIIPSNKETFYLDNLLGSGDVSYINNPADAIDKCTSADVSKDSYIEVTRNTTSSMISLSYKVCLKCNNYNNCKEYID